MHILRHVLVLLVVLLFTQAAFSQLNRISYNNQQLFLSGSNLAWINYANDVGSTTPTDTTTFGRIFIQIHNHGGNAVRWWLHTDGTATPEFSSVDSTVIGPGVNTISDLRNVLDIAWQREIGVDICLWSFGMLNTSNSSLVQARNKKLLLDTNYTRAYINNCLIPMVTALKGHPAIIAWEIFNEPEGMSTQYGGFGAQQLVSMTVIERFINLCAGAIHRTDTAAQVTSGAWSFYALSDQVLAKSSSELSKISSSEKSQIASFYQHKYGSTLTPDEIILRLQKIAAQPSSNWYRDDRLIAAGGDTQGTLDFYSVHYYSTSTPVSTSPFTHPASYWSLTKPIVVGEFPMNSGQGAPLGFLPANLLDTLDQLGYAGALPWSWSDAKFSTQAYMLAGMQTLWNAHRADVDLLGTGADWPLDTIKYPLDGATFPDSTQVTIQVSVTDSSAITSVDIIVNDTAKIATLTTAPYNFTWTSIQGGIYNITAVATNSLGHSQISNVVKITVGKPPMVRLEAENATRHGSGVTVVTDNTASNNKYVNMATNDSSATITWKLTSVPAAGNYPITFGFKLNAGHPKSQFININGIRADTIVFTDSIQTWHEETINVNLLKDTNSIQISMWWGWMALDYLAVPTSIVTSVKNISNIVPTDFSLQQNYPNPFNPTTTIQYSLPQSGQVKLIVYDVLGRQVATLIDEKKSAGVYNVSFNAARLTSGVYFYRLNVGTFTETKKMLVLK
jgi:Bacterial Ig domain/Secretion system C-terminal sorting domain/Carbohydrate binding module (family 35)